MDIKVLVKVLNKSNLLDSLVYFFNEQKIEYLITNNIDKIDETITHLIYICNDNEKLENISVGKALNMIVIEQHKNIIENDLLNINYVLTKLTSDEKVYTKVQKDYLFKRGSYSMFLNIVSNLLKNRNNYNGIIYDLTNIKEKYNDWTFDFESINDTYKWLSRQNKSVEKDYELKIISFYSDIMYDNSLREINYLAEKLLNIKNGIHMTDIFIFTKDEFLKYSENYFFKLLLKNCSNTYKLYIINKDELEMKEMGLINELLDGIIIYKDCVYRDTYDNELSLGYVNCNYDVVKKYNSIFKMLIDKYGNQITEEGNIDGIFG